MKRARQQLHSEQFQPFYFTSYGTVIGKARNVQELLREMKRLAKYDRPCLEYHLAHGHIASWLEYIHESDLAKDMICVKDVDAALNLVERHFVRSFAFHGMQNRWPL